MLPKGIGEIRYDHTYVDAESKLPPSKHGRRAKKGIAPNNCRLSLFKQANDCHFLLVNQAQGLFEQAQGLFEQALGLLKQAEGEQAEGLFEQAWDLLKQAQGEQAQCPFMQAQGEQARDLLKPGIGEIRYDHTYVDAESKLPPSKHGRRAKKGITSNNCRLSLFEQANKCHFLLVEQPQGEQAKGLFKQAQREQAEGLFKQATGLFKQAFSLLNQARSEEAQGRQAEGLHKQAEGRHKQAQGLFKQAKGLFEPGDGYVITCSCVLINRGYSFVCK
ncbi:hypothetical protein LWI29_014496 [Acer saccharum]|uniref:Uncharacterized protein n=1 Tax=Acer saccharum TaxID=4024 RepID=A0AA39SSH1_ACESA|nr:hypothetical protein LWI29_014496 [Acer saccharum]